MGPDSAGLAAQSGVRFVQLMSNPDGEMLEELVGLVNAGALRPVLAECFSLVQVAEAYERLSANHAPGKNSN